MFVSNVPSRWGTVRKTCADDGEKTTAHGFRRKQIKTRKKNTSFSFIGEQPPWWERVSLHRRAKPFSFFFAPFYDPTSPTHPFPCLIIFIVIFFFFFLFFFFLHTCAVTSRDRNEDDRHAWFCQHVCSFGTSVITCARVQALGENGLVWIPKRSAQSQCRAKGRRNLSNGCKQRSWC